MVSTDKGGRSNLQWIVLTKVKVKFTVDSTDKGGRSNLQWIVLAKVEGPIHSG